MYNFRNYYLAMPGGHIHKISFVTRLTIVIIIATLMLLSAKTSAQTVTFTKKNATIKDLFAVIKEQTGYKVIWNEEKLNINKSLNVNFNKAGFDEVLGVILKEKKLIYTIIYKTIVIKEVEPTSRKINEEQIDVRGTVVDNQNQPLTGAIVKVKGSNEATSVNSKGEFTLKRILSNSTLIISFIGFVSIEVKASNDIGVIQLTYNSNNLNEVEINTGYYAVKGRELTGSIGRVSTETISKQPINNPLMALQNRVTGLEVRQLSGIPGSGFTVQIRGKNGFGARDPFYIIDGVPYPSGRINNSSSNNILEGGANPLSMINPNDIESIEVLKDADATAIYGSRGANGVILITTKKGKAGLTKVDANVTHGFAQVGNRLDLMNTEQYLAMRMEALKNDGVIPVSTEYDVNGVWDKQKYTDWQKELIGGTAGITNASLTALGGNNKARYLISGNYYSEGTVFNGNSDFKRSGIHSSLTLGTTENRFNATINLTYSHVQSTLLSGDPTQSITLAPNYPDLKDQYGQLNWTYNNTPIYTNSAASLYNTVSASTDNLIGNAVIGFKILDNLILKTSIGYTIIRREELAKRPLIAQPPATNPTSAVRTSNFGNTYNNTFITEPQLNYKLNIADGKLDALLGMSFQQNSSGFRNIVASNFNSDELMDNIQSASVFKISESSSADYKYAAIFGRINYSLQERYYINLTGRRDASSRFGPGKQFANFGALGAAWIFSEEKLMQKQFPFLNYGKLRMSYGITGSDQINDYNYLQLYTSSGSYQGISTLITERIANPDYGWETNRKGEIALELKFLNDMINVQTAFFHNQSSNLLTSSLLPPSVGAASIQTNLPATVQNTGWEIEVKVKWLRNEQLNWQISFNITIPKNKLIAYPNLTASQPYIIGEPLGIKRLYNSYVDPIKGLYTSEDYNGNGIVDSPDMYLYKLKGQFFYGGLQNSISYNKVSLDFLISFSKQNGDSFLAGLNNIPGTFSNVTPLNNMPVAVLNRWQKSGDQTLFPKFTNTSAGRTNFNQIKSFGSQSISDASYLRLKNIALSYLLPERWLSKSGASALEITAQGQNLFTLTKYEGFDPESQLINRLPPLRVLSFGLKLTL